MYAVQPDAVALAGAAAARAPATRVLASAIVTPNRAAFCRKTSSFLDGRRTRRHTDGGTGQIWAVSAGNVAAGTQATVSVPAGKLADGWLVRWRARAASATATSSWSDWQLLTVDPANVGEEPLAAAPTPLVRTDESFAIASWVRLDDKDGRYAIAGQKGASTAPFHLGVDPAHGLVFTMKQSDSATSPEEGAVSETAPPVGEWFHLAGSYDGDSKTLSLYLNGNLIKTQAIGFRPWHADGAFTIGTAIRGGIDDLWVYPGRCPRLRWASSTHTQERRQA